MINVTIEDELIGHIEKFPGNLPAERWAAYLPRQAGDVGTYPARRLSFPTRKAAVAWLLENHASDTSDQRASEKSEGMSEEKSEIQ
ncbi:hypothetical protein [Sinorhizobium sp. BJ1]|uniref:hypothetical protein n=1 Tax=Sinorhizobium sp. BJ1 TaxID=2035455 RepID=UPI000BEA3641|nr:hypothetical protein [Sinorhizobium sp. BJ1]PDT80606.1 hypothetical protein CO676_26765 [Sinorhizobium sp. BJ1]